MRSRFDGVSETVDPRSVWNPSVGACLDRLAGSVEAKYRVEMKPGWGRCSRNGLLIAITEYVLGSAKSAMVDLFSLVIMTPLGIETNPTGSDWRHAHFTDWVESCDGG